MLNKDRSLKKFYETFDYCGEMPDEWKGELENYLIHGYHPGSFHTALFENNLMRATMVTHPSNKWIWIVTFMKWIWQHAPQESYGSKEQVEKWLKMSKEQHRDICEKAGILATAWELLKMKEEA